MEINETTLGFEQITKNFHIFFGKNTTTIDQLKSEYSNYEFRQIKQTHSDICIPSKSISENTEADAHYSTEKNKALVVRTADCLPILVYDSALETVLSVHAGWKGVENRIFQKSVDLTKLKNLQIFIGPHIHKQSFEVETDVYQKLQASYVLGLKNKNYSEADIFEKVGSKFHIDLKKIVMSSIDEKIVTQLTDLNFDTLTRTDFHSYRRHRENAGRNLSFIVKL